MKSENLLWNDERCRSFKSEAMNEYKNHARVLNLTKISLIVQLQSIFALVKNFDCCVMQ